MPLTATQFDFLVSRLGIGATNLAGHPKALSRHFRSISDYLAHEASVIQGIRQLASCKVPQEEIEWFEQQVRKVQQATSSFKVGAPSASLMKSALMLDEISIDVDSCKTFHGLLGQAWARQQALPPVVRPEADGIAAFLDQLAESETPYVPACEALANLLETGLLPAEQLANEYGRVYSEAATELQQLKSRMPQRDWTPPEQMLLDAAELARQGRREAALRLIPWVKLHCEISGTEAPPELAGQFSTAANRYLSLVEMARDSFSANICHALYDRFLAARGQADRRAYGLASDTLDQLLVDCEAGWARIREHGEYQSLLAEMTPRVHALLERTRAGGEVAPLQLLLQQAMRVAERNPPDHVGACEALLRLRLRCETYERVTIAQEEADAQLRGLLAVFSSDRSQAVAETRKLLAALGQREGSMPLSELQATIDPLLVKAESLEDERAATVAFEEAIKACMRVVGLPEEHAAFAKQFAEITRARTGLDPADPTVQRALPHLNPMLERARKSAVAHRYVAAEHDLDDALQKLREIRLATQATNALKERIARLRFSIVVPSDAVPGSADLWRQFLVPLQDRLTRVDMEISTPRANLFVADRTLTGIEGDHALLMARELVNTPGATPEAIKQQLKVLQAVGKLGEFVKDTQHRDPGVLLLALEVRFKLKERGAVYGFGTPSGGPKLVVDYLQRVYKVLEMLPEALVRDNPSLESLTMAPATTSLYDPPTKTITLAVEPAELTTKLVGSLLHEVGHAVDDKTGFMGRNQMGAAWGGWQVYDVQGVALEIAREFAINGVRAIDAQMIADYLRSGLEPPAPPEGWGLVRDWALGVREARLPWCNGVACSKTLRDGGFRAGDYIYHEGYPNYWVRYLWAARLVGVSDAMFKAPAEFFAEAFAAYMRGVLGDAHPLAEDLRGLRAAA